MTTLILCRQCSGQTTIRQTKHYSYGTVTHRRCKQCGYTCRYQVTPEGEQYLGEILRRGPEALELRQRVQDMLFRLERGGKMPPYWLEGLRQAGRKLGVL